MTKSRLWVNALSLSRVVFALVFVVSFQRIEYLYYLSVGLCLAALLTDIGDGFLARRMKVASVHGRLWDSLGDKAFYAAVIIAFHAQGYLDTLVTWGLIVRETALYITRILFIYNLPQVEKIRPWTNWHGYFMYLMIILGLTQMYAEIQSMPLQLHPFLQVSAYAALVFGIGSIFSFIRLQKSSD